LGNWGIENYQIIKLQNYQIIREIAALKFPTTELAKDKSFGKKGK